MQLRQRWLRLFTALVLVAGPIPVAASETRTVVELFTSQGCSSCPAADRLLGELAADPRLIAISLNVDYWDYIGWRDTLALSAHSARQKGYADMRGDRQVYTPQVVANGTVESIGSDRKAVERAIAKAQTNGGMAIPVSIVRANANLDIEVGAGAGPAASVWILAVTRSISVKIKRGENRGKTITYYNVVRSWKRLTEWNGAPVRTSLPISEIGPSGADLAAVFLQSGSVEKPGPIRGGAIINLH